ncbi:MAG: RHS repeat-associated core domain-containing protein, partial [Bryobacteraceae bacterium]
SKTVTKGSAPVMTLAVNPLTNRITGQGYDANGNLLSLPAGGTGAYDAENRLVAVPGATYGYDGSNKRIWRWTGSVDGYGFGNASGLQLYLCWVDGKQWGTYVTSIYTNTGVQMAPLLLDSVGTLNVYFRGKKVGTGQAGALVAFVQDRLGSSVKTYPYGEEKVPNGVDGWKFATYLRDTATNLDYADQRFYANTQGRFLSADPYAASGGAGDPGSWNRYAYVQGDPVNFKDSSGLFVENTSSCGAPGTDYCMDADTLQIWGDMGSLSIGGFTMSIAFLQAGNGPQQGGGGSLTPGPPSCAESVERLYGSLDANEVAAVSVILGENSWVYLGKNQYQDGERYGRGSLSPLGVEDVFLEDQYMADVLINRTERSGRSLASVASAQGQFLGYAAGVTKYTIFGSEDSLTTDCTDLTLAVYGLKTQESGPRINTEIMNWVATVQHGRARRRRLGDIRIGDTDFSRTPFR